MRATKVPRNFSLHRKESVARDKLWVLYYIVKQCSCLVMGSDVQESIAGKTPGHWNSDCCNLAVLCYIKSVLGDRTVHAITFLQFESTFSEFLMRETEKARHQRTVDLSRSPVPRHKIASIPRVHPRTASCILYRFEAIGKIGYPSNDPPTNRRRTEDFMEELRTTLDKDSTRSVHGLASDMDCEFCGPKIIRTAMKAMQEQQ